jgi:hypothetical protein
LKSTSENSWGKAYYDHFQRFLGSPTSRCVFSPIEGLYSIQILGFENVFRGCRVFCSLGLSHYQEFVKGVREVIVPCDAAWDLIPRAISNVLFYAIKEHMEVGRGIAVSGIETVCPEFVRLTGKSALYFTEPFGLPPDFSSVRIPMTEGRVFLGIFISQGEYDYFCDNGAERFEEMLEAKGVDPYALLRDSSI